MSQALLSFRQRSNQYLDFYDVPRWDDGTPLDPAKYPEAYRRHRAERYALYRGIYVFPINPAIPPAPTLVPFIKPILVP